MAQTTTPRNRPAWLVLTIFAALVLVTALTLNALLGDTGRGHINTDTVVDSLCQDTPDC